jgi:hypothetical protein
MILVSYLSPKQVLLLPETGGTMFWSMCCGFFGTQPGHELSLVHLSPTRGPMLVRRVVGPLDHNWDTPETLASLERAAVEGRAASHQQKYFL